MSEELDRFLELCREVREYWEDIMINDQLTKGEDKLYREIVAALEEYEKEDSSGE